MDRCVLEWNQSIPNESPSCDDDINATKEQNDGNNDHYSLLDNKFSRTQEVLEEEVLERRSLHRAVHQPSGVHGDEAQSTSSLVKMDRYHVVSESPPKRRRLQRRNSTTAQMLLTSSMTTMIPPLKDEFGLMNEEEKEKEQEERSTTINNNGYDKDIGIIAQDRVRQVQANKRTMM